MKNELTIEEQAQIEITKNKWINLGFEKCKLGIDKEKFETGIEWLYDKYLKLPKPEFVYCDSLVDAVIKITLVKDYGKELSDYTPELLSDYLNNRLDADFVSKIEENFSLKSSYIGWSNFGWVSFYDYFTTIGVINNDDFNQYKNIIESNVFECFEFEKVIFAVNPPIYIKHNQNLVPHCIDGPSIEFRDGVKLHHINSFFISETLFNSLNNKTYTFEDFAKEQNEEVKSAVVSFIQEKDGDSGMYYFLKNNLTEIDTYTDVKDEDKMVGTTRSTNIGVYTLFKGVVNEFEVAYVRCYCPSTDRIFFLGVEPNNTNAKDAIASLYRIPKVLKTKIKHISRQGEKFSTVFDDETTTRLKNNEFSVEDLKDYTNLSGTEYFKLMKYEY